MKKRYRIKKTEEFQKIIGKKKYKNTPSFTIYTEEKRDESSRYGISVSKKLGNAVFRNKTKRQVRNMLEEIGDFNTNFDAIIMVRKKYNDQSYDTNKKDLEKLLKTVKI